MLDGASNLQERGATVVVAGLGGERIGRALKSEAGVRIRNVKEKPLERTD